MGDKEAFHAELPPPKTVHSGQNHAPGHGARTSREQNGLQLFIAQNQRDMDVAAKMGSRRHARSTQAR